jgi:hypothetical protein
VELVIARKPLLNFVQHTMSPTEETSPLDIAQDQSLSETESEPTPSPPPPRESFLLMLLRVLSAWNV